MFWNRTGHDIVSQWQAELSHCVEMGRAPLYYLGYSNNALNGILAVQTLDHFLSHSRAVATPRALMGGESALWLYATLQSRSMPPAPGTSTLDWPSKYSGPTVIFTGVDLATHMASMDITAGTESNVSPLGGRTGFISPLGLPRSMRWLYAPITEPAADAPWSAVPFLWPPAQAVQTRTLARLPKSHEPFPAAVQPLATGKESQATWLAWCTMVFVGTILLAALFG